MLYTVLPALPLTPVSCPTPLGIDIHVRSSHANYCNLVIFAPLILFLSPLKQSPRYATYINFVHSSISSPCAIDRGTSLPDHETAGTMSVSQTKLQTVQIVLPVHANHHGTTFGGQVSLPPKCSFRPPLDNFYDEGLQYICGRHR